MINKYKPTVILLLIILVSFTQLRVLSLIALLFIAASYSRLPIRAGILTKMILHFLFISCFFQIYAMSTYLLGLEATSPYVPYFIWGLIIASIYLRNKKTPMDSLKEFIHKDFAYLLISIFSIFIIFYPVISKFNTQQLLRFYSSGFDYSVHLSLFKTSSLNKSYVYGNYNDVKDKIVYEDLNGYPQGWHLSNTMLWDIVAPFRINSNYQIMYSMFATLLIWYAILIFLLCALYDKLLPEKVPYRKIHVFIFTAFIQGMLTISFIRYGFMNFIGCLSYLVALIYILAVDTNKYSQRSIDIKMLIIAMLLVIGAAYSWLLLAPAFFLIPILYYGLKFDDLREFIKHIIKNKAALFSIFVFAIIALIQLIIQMRYGQDGQINEDGGILDVNGQLLLMSTIGTCTYLYLTKSNKNKSIIITSIAGIAFLMASIYLYQIKTVGEPLYYTEKTGLALLTLLLTYASAAIVMFVNSMKIKSFGSLTLIIILYCSSFIAVRPNLEHLRILMNSKYKLSSTSSSQIINLINEDIEPKNIVVYKDLDYEEDLMATHLLDKLSHRAIECKGFIVWALMSKNEQLLIDSLRSCSKDQGTMYVISSQKTYTILSALNSDNIKIVESN